MRSLHITGHGGLERIQFGEVAEPELRPGEVLVEVRAAALNHLDIWVRNGRPGSTMEFPHVLGSDASGVVAEVGAGVKGIKVGEDVLLNPGLSCGACEYCRRGENSECLQFSIIGLGRQGTFAEKVAVPARNVYQRPGHLDFSEAAALPLAHLTAWRMLMTRGRLRPGETVLIHGIGGGVALAALQLAKLGGAEAIVTSSSTEKLQSAQQMGADHVINYRSTQDVGAAVRELTHNRGVDLIIDSVGAQTLGSDLKAVRNGGRVVLCGVTTGAEATADLRAIYWNQVSVIGSTMGSDEDFRQMLKAVSVAKLKPVVDMVRPLERGAEAMGRMEAGDQFGKIVLAV